MIPRFTMRQALSEPDLLGNALVTPPLPAWRGLQRVPSSHSALARAAVRIYNHGTRRGGDGLEGRQGQWRTQPSRIRSGSISPLELGLELPPGIRPHALLDVGDRRVGLAGKAVGHEPAWALRHVPRIRRMPRHSTPPTAKRDASRHWAAQRRSGRGR
jgi:hypothetical protein